jgi:hypothetical protein
MIFSSNWFLLFLFLNSGKLKESTVHSIEDPLKLLECGVFSLKKEAILNKNSSIARFMYFQLDYVGMIIFTR